MRVYSGDLAEEGGSLFSLFGEARVGLLSVGQVVQNQTGLVRMHFTHVL